MWSIKLCYAYDSIMANSFGLYWCFTNKNSSQMKIYGVALSFNPFKKKDFFSLNIFVIRYLCDGSEQLKKTHSQRERIWNLIFLTFKIYIKNKNEANNENNNDYYGVNITYHHHVMNIWYYSLTSSSNS